MAYASTTSVSVEKTEAEIKSIIRKYGAKSFASFEETGRVIIAFEMNDRRIVFTLPLPSQDENRFTHHSRGMRTQDAARQQWEQACRSKWRALFLCIKAKLESVESGIETFEDAFMAHIQMPDGRSVSEHVKPRIAQAYQTGEMRPLLPYSGSE